MVGEQLIKLAKEGDRAAADEIIKSVEPMIADLARKLTMNALCSADELMQTGRIAAFEAIRAYDGSKGAKFSTYAYVCARGRMLDEIKKAARRTENEDIDDEAELKLKREAGIDDTLNAIINNDTIAEIAAVLSGFEFAALFLQAVEKLSYAEIAERLNSNVKAVDNAVARARKKAKLTQITNYKLQITN